MSTFYIFYVIETVFHKNKKKMKILVKKFCQKSLIKKVWSKKFSKKFGQKGWSKPSNFWPVSKIVFQNNNNLIFCQFKISVKICV